MTPWIVLPSFDKIFQVVSYGQLWQLLYLYLQNELEVFVIGFSMRPDDFHTRAILYPQLVHGSQEGYMKVKVIDFADTDEKRDAIRQRFAHVKDCQFWFDGFNEDCLAFIG